MLCIPHLKILVYSCSEVLKINCTVLKSFVLLGGNVSGGSGTSSGTIVAGGLGAGSELDVYAVRGGGVAAFTPGGQANYIKFQLQQGLVREAVEVDLTQLSSLVDLKSFAIQFMDTKVSKMGFENIGVLV